MLLFKHKYTSYMWKLKWEKIVVSKNYIFLYDVYQLYAVKSDVTGYSPVLAASHQSFKHRLHSAVFFIIIMKGEIDK